MRCTSAVYNLTQRLVYVYECTFESNTSICVHRYQSQDITFCHIFHHHLCSFKQYRVVLVDLLIIHRLHLSLTSTSCSVYDYT